MDPLDDFEFKPLTEGLGFHKKTPKLQEQQTQSPSQQSNQMGKPVPTVQSLEDLLKTLEKPMTSSSAASSATSSANSVQITQTLPRPGSASAASAASGLSAASAMDTDIPFPSPMPSHKSPRGGYDIPTPGSEVQIQRPPSQTTVQRPIGLGPKRGAADSPIRKLEPATVSIQAAILDGIVVTAVTLLFLVSLILVTKIDILSVLLSAQTDLTTQFSVLLLFLSVMQMYVVVARSFYGRTLGEWTFDYQLGQDYEHDKSIYPLQVVARSLLMLGTGLIILPVLSLILGRDLAGQLTGVQLFHQKVEPIG